MCIRDRIYHDLKAIEEEPEIKQKEELEWQFEKEISVKKVCYHYPDSEDMVIDNASFEIPKGKTVAFIGPSGAGKTTMVDIISVSYTHLAGMDCDVVSDRTGDCDMEPVRGAGGIVCGSGNNRDEECSGEKTDEGLLCSMECSIFFQCGFGDSAYS